MIIYTRNKAYQKETIILTPNCTVINLSGTTIQCIIYSTVIVSFCREEGSIPLSFPLPFTSLKLLPDFCSLISSFPLSCLCVSLTLQITAIPLQLSFFSCFSPEYYPALKSFGKYLSSSLSLHLSLCHCLLVCVFVYSQVPAQWSEFTVSPLNKMMKKNAWKLSR